MGCLQFITYLAYYSVTILYCYRFLVDIWSYFLCVKIFPILFKHFLYFIFHLLPNIYLSSYLICICDIPSIIFTKIFFRQKKDFGFSSIPINPNLILENTQHSLSEICTSLSTSYIPTLSQFYTLHSFIHQLLFINPLLFTNLHPMLHSSSQIHTPHSTLYKSTPLHTPHITPHSSSKIHTPHFTPLPFTNLHPAETDISKTHPCI